MRAALSDAQTDMDVQSSSSSSETVRPALPAFDRGSGVKAFTDGISKHKIIFYAPSKPSPELGSGLQIRSYIRYILYTVRAARPAIDLIKGFDIHMGGLGSPDRLRPAVTGNQALY